MKARGKIESFEPTNLAGVDTRIWQGKGAASEVDGIVFSSRGEVVKVGGLQRLVRWADVSASDGLTSGNPFYASPENDLTDKDFIEDDILTLGTFFWGGTTELLVAHYRKDEAASPERSVEAAGTVFISVLETDKLREIYSYRVVLGRPHPDRYPRFADVGQFVFILVEGMRPMKWDGRITTPVGIYELPSAPECALLLGQGDDGDAEDDPTMVGDFWNRYSFNQDDATGVKIQYFQTYINKYGQESNLSAGSKELYLNELLGVSETVSIVANITSSGEDPGSGDSPAADRYRAEQMKQAELAMSTVANSEGSYWDSSAEQKNAMRNEDQKDRRLVAFVSLGDPPSQLDVVQRGLYRSLGGQAPTALPRRLGAAARTHFDVRRLAASSVRPAPRAGENSPPPNARWAFPFRGRTYYRGPNGDLLYYSKVNFPEAVAPTNFIQISTNDGDTITAWGAAQDYAIIFKRNSAYLLTHNKEEAPVLTPLQSTYGAVSDRGVISFDNNTYFVSDVGFHLFDGSSFKRISSVLDERVRQLPKHTREGLCVFSEADGARVYVAVNANPLDKNNEVWVIQTQTGAFSVISSLAEAGISAAVNYKGQAIVASQNTDSRPRPDLFMWDTGYDRDGQAYYGSYSTEWLELKNPHSDKRFYRLLLYYVQTGAQVNMTVEWFLDWDERARAGYTTLTLGDDSGSDDWNDGDNYDAAGSTWDGPRLISKFVDLLETNPSTGASQDISAKSVRFRFVTHSDTRTYVDRFGAHSVESPQTPFKLVGWQVIASDYGERSAGTAKRDGSESTP